MATLQLQMPKQKDYINILFTGHRSEHTFEKYVFLRENILSYFDLFITIYYLIQTEKHQYTQIYTMDQYFLIFLWSQNTKQKYILYMTW